MAAKQPPKNVKVLAIWRLLWLGRECFLLGGAYIPDNCIIGAQSITSSKFTEKNCIIAGNPAKIIRHKIIWARDSARLDYKNYDECKDKEAEKYLMSEGFNNSINVDIWGSCVTRDVFALEKNQNFNVRNYIGRNAIISSLMPPMDVSNITQTMDKISWENRMVIFDFQKECFKKLSQNPAEWLLIDLIDERFGLLQTELCGLTSYVTYSQVLKRSPIFNNLFQKDNVKVIDQDNINEYTVKKMFEVFCNKILSIYKSDHIILIKVFPVKEYITRQGEILKFDGEESEKIIEKYRKRLHRYYNLIENNLGKSINVINMPDNTMAYEGHKWGLATTHYTDSYYEYMLTQIESIILGNV